MQARTQHVAQGPQFGADHVCLGNEVRTEQLSQRKRVHAIGLHLGGADRLELPGMGEREIDPMLPAQIRKPIPAARRLHHGTVRTRKA
jgi:hypothetical protein